MDQIKDCSVVLQRISLKRKYSVLVASEKIKNNTSTAKKSPPKSVRKKKGKNIDNSTAATAQQQQQRRKQPVRKVKKVENNAKAVTKQQQQQQERRQQPARNAKKENIVNQEQPKQAKVPQIRKISTGASKKLICVEIIPDKEYVVGEIVLAAIKGHASWPARILTMHKMIIEVGTGQVLVTFYNF